MPNTLVLDIETAPHPKRVALLDPPTPPANIKDPAKIAAWIAANPPGAKAALDPTFGLIVCYTSASIATDSDTAPHTCTHFATADLTARTHPTEDDANLILGLLNAIATADQLVTFNGRRFDLPFILRRAMIQDIPLPPGAADFFTHPDHACLSPNAPHHDVMLDLHDQEVGGSRASSPTKQKRTLHYYARHLLGSQIPADPLTQDKTAIADAYFRGDLAGVAAVCEFDVAATLNLHLRLKAYAPSN